MELSFVCNQVCDLARLVGFFIVQQSQQFDKSKIEYKGLNDLVSYVDKEAEKRLMDGLQQILPEAGFVSEENPTTHQLTDKPLHWIIDPLDGTTNFIHGLPIFAISIALMQNNEVILGVVYEANRKECFYAWKNGGAYCNAVKIKVSEVLKLENSLLATGFPYQTFEQKDAYLKILGDLMQHSHGLRRTGSAAVDLAYTACGRFEGFFEFNLKAWDVAAGALLVQEAGGKVSKFTTEGDFIFGKEILASCAIFDEMRSVIQKYW
jgi:myo-inositol-1(or 4)-monophosphatase